MMCIDQSMPSHPNNGWKGRRRFTMVDTSYYYYEYYRRNSWIHTVPRLVLKRGPVMYTPHLVFCLTEVLLLGCQRIIRVPPRFRLVLRRTCCTYNSSTFVELSFLSPSTKLYRMRDITLASPFLVFKGDDVHRCHDLKSEDNLLRGPAMTTPMST